MYTREVGDVEEIHEGDDNENVELGLYFVHCGLLGSECKVIPKLLLPAIIAYILTLLCTANNSR